MTKKERWDVAIAVAATTCYIVYLFASLYAQREGMGDGLFYRFHWAAEQQRKAKEREAEYQRLCSELHFDLWQVEQGASPI